jgi:hypothetical protein
VSGSEDEDEDEAEATTEATTGTPRATKHPLGPRIELSPRWVDMVHQQLPEFERMQMALGRSLTQQLALVGKVNFTPLLNVELQSAATNALADVARRMDFSQATRAFAQGLNDQFATIAQAASVALSESIRKQMDYGRILSSISFPAIPLDWGAVADLRRMAEGALRTLEVDEGAAAQQILSKLEEEEGAARDVEASGGRISPERVLFLLVALISLFGANYGLIAERAFVAGATVLTGIGHVWVYAIALVAVLWVAAREE